MAGDRNEQGKAGAGRRFAASALYTDGAEILPLIDFEKARTTNTRTIASTIKRVLPDHHVHELRHTYVSRCKECGVAGEVVSIWVGHSLTGTITSTVYTHYSEEFQMKEAEKVNYAL